MRRQQLGETRCRSQGTTDTAARSI
jgi:hypothetical protein